MKLPLSLIVGAFGVGLDFLSKAMVVLMGFPVVWHETNGDSMYLYTNSGLEFFTREVLIKQVIIAFICILLIIILAEKVVFKTLPKTRLLSQIFAGVMIVPFAQEVLALFAPVPNFIPAHTYMMFVFYENMWSVATVGDFARSFGMLIWVAMVVMWIWESYIMTKKETVQLNGVYP